MRPGRVRVQELLLIGGTGVPAGPVEQPAAVWQRAVLTFPLFDVLDFEQEVGIGGRLGAEIEDHGRRDELTHRHLRHVRAVLAGHPVHRRVEMRPGVLPGADVVPVPGRAAVAIPADFGQRKGHGITERLRQLEHRRRFRQWRGEVDDLHAGIADGLGQGLKHGHGLPPVGDGSLPLLAGRLRSPRVNVPGPARLCYVINMTEKKAVLNVTISESLAADVRRAAKLEHTTISSVVERALARQVSWELKRLDGLAAIEEYYKEHGYPTEEERAAAKAAVEEEERLIDEARAYNAAHGGGFRLDDWGAA